MNLWNIDVFDLDEYLTTIGLDKHEPSPSYLGALHKGHVETFPFTSVNMLLGDHPGVSPSVAFDQLVRLKRGGYCLEHAQVFAGIAERLGFKVERRFGRVHSPQNTRSHMTVLITVDHKTYLCDPGFGFSIRQPLPLVDGAKVNQGGRVFSLQRHDTNWCLYRDGSLQHIIDNLVPVPVDVATCHAFLEQGFGPFTSKLMAMRHTTEGHITVTENSKTVRSNEKATVREEISIEEAIDNVVELGVSLDHDRRTRLLQVLNT